VQEVPDLGDYRKYTVDKAVSSVFSELSLLAWH